MIAIFVFVVEVAAAGCAAARRVERAGQEELEAAAWVLTQFSPLERLTPRNSEDLGFFNDGRFGIRPHDLSGAKKKKNPRAALPSAPPVAEDMGWVLLSAVAMRPPRITRLDAVEVAKCHTGFTWEGPGGGQ